MEKKCSGCGNSVFGEVGKTVMCPYCGNHLTFDEPPKANETTIVNNITVAAPNNNRPAFIVNAPPYPHQRVSTHIWLFLFTAGIGNVIYYFTIKSKQKQWEKVYRGT